MRVILAILVILTVSLDAAYAGVCITDVQEASFETDSAQKWSAQEIDYLLADGAYLYESALTCKEIDIITTSMTAVALVMQTTAFGFACTGLGLPATVYLEGGVIAVSAMSLFISSLDCEDPDDEEKMKNTIREAVCEEMEAQGFSCTIPVESI